MGAKTQDSNKPAVDLSSMLAQVLAATFNEMETNVSTWQKVRGSEPVPEFGDPMLITTNSVKVDVRRMMESFRIGCKNLYEIWGTVI